MMRLTVLVLLMLPFCWAHAQDSLNNEVWVKLFVFDKTDDRPIENAQVISYETMQVFATDSMGTFRNVFNPSDSLKVFGLGYEARVVKVARFKTMSEGMELKLARRTYMIRSVDVPAKQELHLHLPEDIKMRKKSETPMALRSNAFASKPPVLAAVINPVSYVHYYTSKKERRKRNAIKEISKAKDQEKINVFFNRDVIKDVSRYVEGEKLNHFIVYCNVNLKVTSRDNPMIVKQRIHDLLKKFESELQARKNR
ncbi:hypothetical protein [Saccharicrinis sp. GN24d3]|uniref:hypothetical protein n=1 Tax=Saccharicrinis sp. GN24d3 TaxID=3458416 RepID=UPI004036AC7E